MLESRTEITVRYAETDMMGIVYHGSYLPWLEIGRTTLLREQGLPYKQLEEEGYRLPVLEVNLKYHRPAVYDDTVTVITTLKEKPTLRLTLHYQLFNGEALLASGHTVHAFIDKAGKPIRPPARFVARMNEVFA
ncbi:MAG: thioesterase family protein [Opitutaceae bacterium]|nr:thioesterase family protein [Opitutaceae bacterium]